MTPLAFFEIGFGEMVVVGIVALLLFGGRLPDVMRTLGATYRSFRRGFEDLSRQAMRPDLTAPPYTPIPPASTKPVPANTKPSASVPAPWAAPAAPTAVASPATPPPVAPPPVAPTPAAPAPATTPRRAPSADDDVPFV
jgi:TatA/E family protein of Tat protein translocase